jgi:hypothetical protein
MIFFIVYALYFRCFVYYIFDTIDKQINYSRCNLFKLYSFIWMTRNYFGYKSKDLTWLEPSAVRVKWFEVYDLNHPVTDALITREIKRPVFLIVTLRHNTHLITVIYLQSKLFCFLECFLLFKSRNVFIVHSRYSNSREVEVPWNSFFSFVLYTVFYFRSYGFFNL